MKENIYLALIILPCLLNGMECQRPTKKARIDTASNNVEANFKNLNEVIIQDRIPLHIFDHKGSITAANFSKDGTCIVSTSLDNTAKLWNTATGTCVKAFEHKGPVKSGIFRNDGKEILTSSGESRAVLTEARCLNIKTGGCPKILYHFNDTVNSAIFNHDCSRILTTSNVACLWEARTGKHLQTYSHHGLIAAAFNYDATRILTVAGGTVKLWDATVHDELLEPEVGASINRDLCLRTFSSTGLFTSAVFSHGGVMIVTASTDKSAKVWDTNTGDCLRTFNHDAAVNAAVFNHNGTRVLTISGCTAKLWDIATGNLLATFTHNNNVNSALFNHNGTQILTASTDATAKLWNATTYTCLQIFDHQEPISSAKFNHNGTCVLTLSDSVAKLWDNTKLLRLSEPTPSLLSTIKEKVFTFINMQG